MAVVKIVNGVVVQTWRDVQTVADAVEKYGFDPVDLVEGDHPPGTPYNGSVFLPPLPVPVTPDPENPERQALRALAVAIDSESKGAVALINALLGPAP